MHVDVDWDLCDGQGECARVAPAVFELDDDRDQVVIRQPEPSEALRVLVEEAVRSCPKAALRLADAGEPNRSTTPGEADVDVRSADPVVVQNKQVVLDFFEALSESRFDDAFALTDPVGVIHLPSPRQTVLLPRWRAVYEALMESQFPEGCRYEIGRLIGEGSYVAVITESFALMRTGSLYNNLYHWMFRLESGRIVEIHEFMDSLYAHRTIHAAGWDGRRGDDS